MTTYMHCRPCCATDISTCSSSFFFIHPDYISTSTYQTYNPLPYHQHDQAPLPPPVPPRRRRRLEDPIITYASNYYATLPRPMSQSSTQPPPLPPPRQIYQQTDRKNIYCDLFNLLERPSPPSPSLIKHRRKYTHNNNHSPCRYHRSIIVENTHTKVKNKNDRKHHYQQSSSSYKEKKRQDDKLLSIEQYDQSTEKTKKINDIYLHRSSNKGFFRRVVRNYFCMPSTVANNDYSS